MRLTEFVCYPVVTVVRLGMIKRMLSEVRQDANFTIKERGPRMAQIEKLTMERIEQPNDVLKTPVEDSVEVTKIIQMVQQSSKEQIVDATTSQVVEESW